jgi:hypothetical protein
MKRFAGCIFGLVLAACGGGSSQSAECKAYLACYGKTGGEPSTLESSYGANGSCWKTAAAAADCTAMCGKGTAAIADAYPDAGC